MIGKAKRLGGPRQVPVVLLQRVEQDLALRLRFERLERSGRRVRICRFIAIDAATKSEVRDALLTRSA